MNKLAMVVALATTAVSLTGCPFSYYGRVRVRTPTVQVRARPVVRVPVVAVATPPPTNVQVVQVSCQQGAQEQCNGIDDNCNGAIDEGCGYETGNIQITAAWQGSADIDLHVHDPAGSHIYYGGRESPTGGILDRDANAACNQSQPTVENVYWASAPPAGDYRVRVHAYDMCGMAQVPVTLSVSIGGRIMGTYQYTMQRQNDEFVVPFRVGN